MELLALGVGNSFRLMGLVSDVETRGVSAASMVIRICFVSDNRATAADGNMLLHEPSSTLEAWS